MVPICPGRNMADLTASALAGAQTHVSPGGGGFSTAGDDLINSVTAAANHVLALTPAEIGINVALTVVVIGVAATLGLGLHRMVESRLKSMAEGDRARASRAMRWGRTLLRLAIVVGAAWLVLVVWGVDPLAWWVGAGGRQALKVLGRLALLSFILLATLELAGFLIRRTMGNLAHAARDPRRAAQIRTLSPLLR